MNTAIEILVSVDPVLAPDQRHIVHDEALASAKAIGDAFYRSRALAVLAPHLALEQRLDVLGEALVSAKAIGDVNQRSRALAALAPHLAAERARRGARFRQSYR